MSADFSAARRRGRRSALVQLVVFLALTGVLTFVIASQIARLDFRETYTVTAVFDDVSGLMEGDKVKIAGAPVGQVGSIKVRNGKAVVTLNVDTAHRVPADSEAAIRWRDAISQRVVYLIPGSAPAMLQDGDEVARTRNVVDIGDLIARIEPLTRALDPARVNAILAAVYAALEGNEENISHLLADVDQLTSVIATRKDTLRSVLADFGTVTEIIARRDDQLAQATDDLATLSKAFVDNRELVETAIDELAAMLSTTDKVLGRNADQLAETLDGLAYVMGGARRNLDPLVGLSDTIGPKLQRLYDLFNDGQYVVGAVPCLTLSPGPCPYKPELAVPPGTKKDKTGKEKTAAVSPVQGQSLEDLLVGVG